jgi:hypothetical protein
MSREKIKAIGAKEQKETDGWATPTIKKKTESPSSGTTPRY